MASTRLAIISQPLLPSEGHAIAQVGLPSSSSSSSSHRMWQGNANSASQVWA